MKYRERKIYNHYDPKKKPEIMEFYKINGLRETQRKFSLSNTLMYKYLHGEPRV